MSKIFVRTRYDLGDYNDDTKTGPGLTDQSQHETMTDLVERVLRGEVVTKNHMIYDFDEDCKLTEDEQFESEDITQTDGFELSDAPVILETIKADLDKENQVVTQRATDEDSSEEVAAPTQSNATDEGESK